MILLSTTVLELVTTTTETIHVVAAWNDIDKTGATAYTPGQSQAKVSAAGTATIVAAPASATVYRVITELSLYNAGGAANALTVQKDVSGTDYVIQGPISFAAGEAVRYDQRNGWDRYTALGERMTSGRDGTDGATGPAGVGTAGTAELNFGSWPGSAHATVAVADATSLGASRTEAWLLPAATADHTADEHLVENIRIIASAPTGGVGFTIHGFLPDRPGPAPLFTTQRNNAGGRSNVIPTPVSPFKRARLYGRWSVAWRWS